MSEKRHTRPAVARNGYVLEVPVTITYRLESDYHIIEQEKGTMPIEVNDEFIEKLEAICRTTGLTREKIINDFITSTYAKRLSADKQALKRWTRIVRKHKTNTLIEVSIDGEVPWPLATEQE